MWWKWGLCLRCCPRFGSNTSATKLFELKEVLSENSSGGDVYRAVNRETHQVVAVKVIAKTALRDKDLRRRIRREVRILSRMKHTNIVRLYGVFSSSNTLEIVFEFSKGGQVSRRIVDPNEHLYRFNEVEISRVLQDFMSALAFLHSKHIVHQSVRPEHIMYASRDLDSKILIADFGQAQTFSKVISTLKKKRQSGQTVWNSMMDLYFLPPFAVTNDAEPTRKHVEQLDIWAAGVVLYTMIFAKFPFEGSSRSELISRILEEPLTFPEDLDAYASRAVKDLIHRMLQKDPENGISAQEVREHPWVQSGAASVAPFSPRHRELLKTFANRYEQLRNRDSKSESPGSSSAASITSLTGPSRSWSFQSIPSAGHHSSVVSTECHRNANADQLNMLNSSPDRFIRIADDELSMLQSDTVYHPPETHSPAGRTWRDFFGLNQNHSPRNHHRKSASNRVDGELTSL